MRDHYFQSSLADILENSKVKKKWQDMMEELTAIGASIEMMLHDEIHFRCVQGTEDQVRAIHNKYFPKED